LGFGFGGLAFSILPGWLLAKLAMSLGMPESFEVVPYIVSMAACVLTYAWFADKSEVFDAVPAYFYVRNKLKTAITFEEARRLSFLFDGCLNGKWYPLTEVRNLPAEQRKQYLFDFANKFIKP
jgi:hypothetical protein